MQFGNNPPPTYMAADHTLDLSHGYGDGLNPVSSAMVLAQDGAGELTQFRPGCEEVYGVIAAALHNLEGHADSVAEATGDAAADGASVDEDAAQVYMSLPPIR